MNKLALIVPYFGTFPNYFQLFLNSCEINSDICDWLIYTDDKRNFNYPENVYVKFCSFSDIQKRIKEKVPCECSIENPYKLCDYKPAYGLIFEETLVGYDFWGHCDVDVIFGKLSNFITDDILENDKLFRLGHLCFYKNNHSNNSRFMMPIEGIYRFREVFSNPQNCIFDEANEYGTLTIEDIWSYYNFSSYTNDNIIANVYYKSNHLQLTFQEDGYKFRNEKKIRNFFLWDKDGLVRYSVNKRTLKKEEFLYIHMMKRKMNVNCMMDSKKLKIISNSFEPIDEHPNDAEQFYKEKYHTFNCQYFRVRFNNLKFKLRKRFLTHG